MHHMCARLFAKYISMHSCMCYSHSFVCWVLYTITSLSYSTFYTGILSLIMWYENV